MGFISYAIITLVNAFWVSQKQMIENILIDLTSRLSE